MRARNNSSHFGCARDMLPETTARLAACSLRTLLVPTLRHGAEPACRPHHCVYSLAVKVVECLGVLGALGGPDAARLWSQVAKGLLL